MNLLIFLFSDVVWRNVIKYSNMLWAIIRVF